VPEVPRNVIPVYAADGAPRGYRSIEAAQRLVQGGFVTAAFGRKGHLKAIFMLREDGANPVEAHLRVGTSLVIYHDSPLLVNGRA